MADGRRLAVDGNGTSRASSGAPVPAASASSTILQPCASATSMSSAATKVQSAHQRPRLGKPGADAVVERIDELLEIEYRSGDLGNLECVLDETIYILLSLQTRAAVYQRLFRELREAYPSWREVLRAPDDELVEILRPGGFQRQRAAKLRKLLEAVAADNAARGLECRSDLTLDYLRGIPANEAERFLKSLPGIGTKSARCIAMYALRCEVFPVDTHVQRIFDRLELVRTTGGKPVHDDFQDLVPKSIRKRLHINLVHHGRAVCKSENPKCDRCTLVSFCERGRAALEFHPNGVVDLFAGAGGMGDGFASAGFKIQVAVELERVAAQTYRANHPGVPVLEADVTDVTADVLRAFAPALKRPVATVAGPPCQGYSAAGPRDPYADRNYLYEQVVRIGTELESAAIVIENVPGAVRVKGIEFADSIVAELRDADYTAEKYLLEAPDFGVPQRRKRYFFIGLAGWLGIRPTEPAATARPPGTPDNGLPETLTLAELLKQLPDRPHSVPDDRLELGDGTFVYNAGTMAHSERVVAKISKIEPGNGPISYRRLDADLARTIIAGHRALPVHPWLDRTMSVREAALVQGFRLDYVFCGKRSEQPLQVANAVPPPLARGVASHVLALVRSSAGWPKFAVEAAPPATRYACCESGVGGVGKRSRRAGS